MERLSELIEEAKNNLSDYNRINELTDKAQEEKLEYLYEEYLKNNIPKITTFDLLNFSSVLFGLYQTEFLLNVKPLDLQQHLEVWSQINCPFDIIILEILTNGWSKLTPSDTEDIVNIIYDDLKEQFTPMSKK